MTRLCSSRDVRCRDVQPSELWWSMKAFLSSSSLTASTFPLLLALWSGVHLSWVVVSTGNLRSKSTFMISRWSLPVALCKPIKPQLLCVWIDASCASRMWSISRWSLSAVSCNAVHRSIQRRFGWAPCLRSKDTTFLKSKEVARYSGVLPSIFRQSTCMPFSRSKPTTSIRPLLAASCRGVLYQLSQTLLFAPAFSNSRLSQASSNTVTTWRP